MFKSKTILSLVVAASILFASVVTPASAITKVNHIPPGYERVDFNGDGEINALDLEAFALQYSAALAAHSVTPTAVPATATAVVNPTATRRPTRTPTVTRTPTAVATSTSTPLPTATVHVHPTDTPLATMPPVVTPGSLAGQVCPAWVHDAYFVVGPNGMQYATWHPQVDPTYLCYFTHEHGDDPRTSLADSSMPAFGYAQSFLPGHIHGEGDEPHVGFKVAVVNHGDVNDEGFAAVGSSRIVFHMGTSGVKRVTTRFHSLEYDMVHPEGWEIHANVMADTGLAGDICERDASTQDSDPSNDIGRTLPIVPSESTCAANSQYEIWGARQTIKLDPEFFTDVEFGIAFATFDGATYVKRDFSDVVLSGDYGCRREAYHEGGHFRTHNVPNGGQWITVTTDALGNVLPNGAAGITQTLRTMGYKIGVQRNTKPGSISQFKLISDNCAPGLQVPN